MRKRWNGRRVRKGTAARLVLSWLLLPCLLAGGCQRTPEPEKTDGSHLPREVGILDVTAYGDRVDISAGMDDRLYLAAGTEIVVKSPWGEDEGSIQGLEDCRNLANWKGKLYAADRGAAGYTLIRYDEASLREEARVSLAVEGSISRMNALDGKLLLVCYEEGEDGHGYGQGYLADMETGALTAYGYGAMAYWGAPVPGGQVLLGESWLLLGDYGGERLTQLDWGPISSAGCGMQDDGRIYYLSGSMLGTIDWEEKYALACAVLEGESYWRLAGGRDMLYAYSQEGWVACVPESVLATQPETVLTLALRSTPLNYLQHCIQDYMLAHPGVLIRWEVMDSFELKKELLAGVDDIDIFECCVFDEDVWSYRQSGVMADLGDYPAMEEWLEDPRLIPGIDRCLRDGEALWGVPTILSLPALAVDPQGLQSRGIEIPEEPWTWAELMTLAVENPEGIVLASPGESDWPAFMADYLAAYYDGENRTVAFDTPQFRELMELWKAYCQREDGHTGAEPAILAQTELYILTTHMGRGDGASDSLEDYPYFFMERPVFTPGQRVWSAGEYTSVLSICENGPNPEAAADFLSFLMSYAQKHRYTISKDEAIVYDIPSQDAYDNDATREDAAFSQIYSDMVEAFLERGLPVYKRVAPYTVMPVYNAEMRSAYQQIIAAYMQGQLTLDELVAGLTEKAEMMLR